MKINNLIPEFVPLIIILIVLLVGAIILSIFSASKIIDLASFAFALFFYALLPGYCILLNFELDKYQRIAFSVPLSIALVSLAIYLMNAWVGISINLLPTAGSIIFFSALGIMIYVLKQKKEKSR